MSFPWFKKRFPAKSKSLVLIVFGLFFLLTAVFFETYPRFEFLSGSPSASLKLEPSLSPSENYFPERLLIPNLRIDLPVLKGEVIDEEWDISGEGVFYLSSSGSLGSKGNVVVYGHNWPTLLGPIRWLKKSDPITLINEKGEEFTYRVQEVKTVTPDRVEILTQTEEELLTLYTCIGIGDRQRLVVVANLDLSEKED